MLEVMSYWPFLGLGQLYWLALWALANTMVLCQRAGPIILLDLFYQGAILWQKGIITLLFLKIISNPSMKFVTVSQCILEVFIPGFQNFDYEAIQKMANKFIPDKIKYWGQIVWIAYIYKIKVSYS